MSDPDTREAWFERYAWLPLVLVQILILVVAMSGPEGPVAEGGVIHAFVTTNVTESVLELRMRGSLVVGMVIFGISIALKPFREREVWAWAVLWYVPLFFLLHIYAFGTVIPDLLLAAIAAVSLLLPYRRFF